MITVLNCASLHALWSNLYSCGSETWWWKGSVRPQTEMARSWHTRRVRAFPGYYYSLFISCPPLILVGRQNVVSSVSFVSSQATPLYCSLFYSRCSRRARFYCTRPVDQLCPTPPGCRHFPFLEDFPCCQRGLMTCNKGQSTPTSLEGQGWRLSYLA